jgi:AcrR family transcriptional regulator
VDRRGIVQPNRPSPARSSMRRRRHDGRSSARKRRAILTAATEVFLQHGYLGASMDEVAARAAVSKQTVYKAVRRQGTSLRRDRPRHHRRRWSTASRWPTRTTLEDAADARTALRDLARSFLDTLTQPGVLQLRRLVVGEADRFPRHLRRLVRPGFEPRALVRWASRWRDWPTAGCSASSATRRSPPTSCRTRHVQADEQGRCSPATARGPTPDELDHIAGTAPSTCSSPPTETPEPVRLGSRRPAQPAVSARSRTVRATSGSSGAAPRPLRRTRQGWSSNLPVARAHGCPPRGPDRSATVPR